MCNNIVSYEQGTPHNFGWVEKKLRTLKNWWKSICKFTNKWTQKVNFFNTLHFVGSIRSLFRVKENINKRVLDKEKSSPIHFVFVQMEQRHGSTSELCISISIFRLKHLLFSHFFCNHVTILVFLPWNLVHEESLFIHHLQLCLFSHFWANDVFVCQHRKMADNFLRCTKMFGRSYKKRMKFTMSKYEKSLVPFGLWKVKNITRLSLMK